MTIEPPLALNRSTVSTVEKMCPEGVAYPAPFLMTSQGQVPRSQPNMEPVPSSYSKALTQPDTPEQYMQDPSFTVGSPSSILMYEQDVSDMQKSLLSPCSNHGNLTENYGSQSSTSGLVQGSSDHRNCIDDLEQSINLETFMSEFTNLEQTKLAPEWSPPVLDTGQAKFNVEDVMMSHNVNQGPTLAQLNEMDSSNLFDDINSIITKDTKSSGKPAMDALVKSGESSSNKTTSAPHMSSPMLSSQTTTVRSTPHIPPVTVKQENTNDNNRVVKNVKANPINNKQQPSPSIALSSIENFLKNSMGPTGPRFTTCTITSPTQEVPMVSSAIKSEPLSPTASYTQPVFNIINHPTTPFIQQVPQITSTNLCSMPFSPQYLLSANFTTLDKPSLQKLLAGPVPTVKQEPLSVKENDTLKHNVKEIKKKTEEAKQLPVTLPKPHASGSKPQTVARHNAIVGQSKEPGSPDSNGSSSSISRKWEEIKRYLETEEGSSQPSTEPPQKKIKAEQPDVAYNPVEEMVSCDQDLNSDSDSELDDISDTESIGSHSSFVEELLVGGKKEKRYFWQYNTQAKGPKGKRLCKTVDPNDPHVLNDFEDPVFDPDINDARYKHNGRARKGDGNDITPSPYKLYQIGNQLKKLNRKIHEIAPAGELSVPTRNKTRREKNKYASRACRLKKKAQHEANKIKLYGLDTEHVQLMTVLDLIKTKIKDHVQNGKQGDENLTVILDKLMKSNLTVMIAGNTADYVNSVLEHVINGDKTGGLNLH